jgi:hypothetical protein
VGDVGSPPGRGLGWVKMELIKKSQDKSNYEVQEGNNFSGTNYDDPVI